MLEAISTAIPFTICVCFWKHYREQILWHSPPCFFFALKSNKNFFLKTLALFNTFSLLLTPRQDFKKILCAVRIFIDISDSDAKRLLVLYSNSCCLSALLNAIILLLCTDLCHIASRSSPNITGIAPDISEEKSTVNRNLKLIKILCLSWWESEWSMCTCERERSEKRFKAQFLLFISLLPLCWSNGHHLTSF